MRRSAPPRGRRLCEYCGTALHERAWRHQSKRCPGYSDLWAMDTYVCFGENLKAHGGEAVLFTVTAPGSDHLAWDESACAVAGDHKHSGELGCQIEAGQALLWNESAQRHFSTAQREAKRRADMSPATPWAARARCRLSELCGIPACRRGRSTSTAAHGGEQGDDAKRSPQPSP